MRNLSEIQADWERKRREYQFLSPNLIWFQRHARKPNIVAEVCRVSNRYRWRAFYGHSNKHNAEGTGKTLPAAMSQVFRFFAKHGGYDGPGR